MMGRPQPDNDQLLEWWQQCQAGNAAALAHLHAALFDSLFLYGVKLLRDESRAADAVQDLFIRIWQKRESLGGIGKLKPYFFSALRRQILNQMRDQRLRDLRLSLMGDTEIEFSREEVLMKNEQDRVVHDRLLVLLNTLPRRQREIIYLHFFEEMPLAQIGEVMNIRYQSVLNLKQRALQSMRHAGLLSLFWILQAAFLEGR